MMKIFANVTIYGNSPGIIGPSEGLIAKLNDTPREYISHAEIVSNKHSQLAFYSIVRSLYHSFHTFYALLHQYYRQRSGN